MNLKYTCRACGGTNEITKFWKWFWTPHFGARKWLKCQHCTTRRHYMKRLNWSGPSWIDWPKDSK
jgi:hypothetical protein